MSDAAAPMLNPETLTVLITGASSGIGAAVARRFAQAGAKVIATARREDRLQALKDEFGARIHIAALDVRDFAAMKALVADLPEPFRNYNVVFANAGLACGLDPAYEAKVEDWDAMVSTNVSGLMYTVLATLPGMVARGEGHVLLTGSIAGDYPYPGGHVYGATKAFAKQFSLGLWADLAGTGVRVTNLEPGMVETEFSVVRFRGDKGRADAVYSDMEPMTAVDIAEQIFFCCTRPRHVNINRLQVMASQQSFAPYAVKRRPR
ncbi:SDR family NAD(P)-dependent oxidoreductase [Xanthobacter sp. TB0139]|uniref:SDR family NAD(P)-dependent oxidoreductase n=1 Tax=Xanthobacter sp. TB0139 TaxID=3459178 RepID=UPI00403971E9